METNHQQKETRLSQQEMEDIKAVSDAIYLDGVFSNLPIERRTEVVCLAAVQADGLNLQDVPEKYKTDEMILNVLRKEGTLLYLVDEKKRTQEMYDVAAQGSAYALEFFPEEKITAEVGMKAVQRNGNALQYVPDGLKTPEMCQIALNNKKSNDYEVIEHVPFADVCLEHLKKYECEGRDPFLLFGNMAEALITPEMAQLAVRLEPSCIQFVPDRLKTPEMCAEVVEKDWMNMRFLPERMKTKELCDIAMKRSIHAQQLVPERFKTPEMYMQHVKADGLNIEYVPEKHRTPEVCLQAVISNPDAKKFVPERFTGDYNIYEFYQGKLKNDFLLAGLLSFEQVQKAFNGEPVHISGMKFAKNVTLRDFTLDYDRKTHSITTKAIDDKPEKKQGHRYFRQPEKRRKLRV